MIKLLSSNRIDVVAIQTGLWHWLWSPDKILHHWATALYPLQNNKKLGWEK
jgi:hypothetical protein